LARFAEGRFKAVPPRFKGKSTSILATGREEPSLSLFNYGRDTLIFIATQGFIKVTPEELIVHFDRRSYNPILREAALDRQHATIPWLGGRRIRFAFN
jgi:hypothetical protein